jgi:hypothetical protein
VPVNDKLPDTMAVMPCPTCDSPCYLKPYLSDDGAGVSALVHCPVCHYVGVHSLVLVFEEVPCNP